MTASNLPPGVGEGDIPGNRPEDLEFELLAEVMAHAVVAAGLNIDPDWFESDVWSLVLAAYENGKGVGFEEGRAEAALDLAARWEQERLS